MILIAAIAAGALQVGAAAAQLTRAAPPSVAPPAVSTQVATPLSFDGAELGMTVAAWKALPPPPGIGQSAAPDCGPAVAAALRDEPTGVAPSGGGTTCAYDARYGNDVLLRSARLDDRYRIEGLRYRFADGRLAEVAYTASIDAYDDITARLTRKYGPPVQTIRDMLKTTAGRFRRVRQTWRTPSGVVRLDDPTADPLRLGVRIESGGAGA